MKIYKIVLCLVFVMMMGCLPAYADSSTAYDRVMEQRVLRCGYIVWKPYIDKDPNTGKISGMSAEVFEAIGKLLNIKIEWTSEIMVGQQNLALDTGKVDAVCGDWPLNPVSATMMEFMDPYTFFPLYLYARTSEENRFKNYADINKQDVKISAMDGDVSLLVADARFPLAKKVQIPQSDDPVMINLNVTTRKADLASNDSLSVHYFNLANPKTKLKPILPNEPLLIVKTSASVKKGEHDLLTMLNQGLELLQASGELDKIVDRYDPKGNLLVRIPPLYQKGFIPEK